VSGVRVPAWVTLGIAVVVIFFGLYRIRMALQKPVTDAGPKRGALGAGYYRMSPRVHATIGVLYLALGGALIATSFGWNPFGRNIGPATEQPAKGEAPVKPSSVPVDTIKP
jgi:hypothetical protein